MELLNQYLALTDDEARLAFLAGLTDEQLTELSAAATEAFAEAEAEAPSDDNLTRLRGLADVLAVVAGQQETREAEQARIEADRQAVIDQVRGSDTGGDGEGEGDGETPPAEGDGTGEGETPPAEGEGADGEGDGTGDGAQTPEAIAAAAAAAGTTTIPRGRPRLQAEQPPVAPAHTTRTAARVALVAGANVPGIAPGRELVPAGGSDLQPLAQAVLAAYNAGQSVVAAGGRFEARVASARGSFPEDRILDENVTITTERMERVRMAAMQGGEALVAAGGFCAPATQRYDLPTVGDSDRPVRDSLMNFGVPRGRVRWMPSPQLADVTGAVSEWTEQDDIDALAGTPVKPCLRFECPDELDAQVYAVTRCLEMGNFNARTYPEQVQAYTDLVGVWHARFAEQLLLAGIDAGSLAVTHGQVLGTTSDALAALDQLVEGIRSRYRINSVRMRVILPDFFRAMVRVDISRQIPGGQTLDERYAIADAAIARWFAARAINVTWTQDSQIFGSQGAGSLIGWPSTVVARVFVEGTWAFLDGGTLDLGIVRDSTLNATNDLQMFAETFEGVAKFGPIQSYVLTMDVCSDGSTSGTVDINPCVSGS